MKIVIEVVRRNANETCEIVRLNLLKELVRIKPVETLCNGVSFELFSEILGTLPPANCSIIGDLGQLS